jgi:hypothetical protein
LGVRGDRRTANLLFVAWPGLVEQIQRGVDLLEKVTDFLSLVGAGVLLQPFQQLLFAREQIGGGGDEASTGGMTQTLA